MKKAKAVDLFSGCGGLTLGLKQAGFRVVGAIELDQSAAKSYRANHRKVILWTRDIRKVAVKEIMRRLHLKVGRLDLLAACPPCQGFSTLRTRNGAKKNRDKRNHLIFEVLRFARVLRPKAIMMENVPRLRRKRIFLDFCRELRSLGYEPCSDIKDAAYYGVPQRRKRLILVAGLGFPISLATESRRLRTVRSAIGKLSKAGRSGDWLHDMTENRSEKVLGIIRQIPQNGGSREDLPDEYQLACHKGFDGFRDIYGRMAWQEVAPTITSGCSNPSKGRFLHPKENRAITMREAALLQSFPPKYRFAKSAGKEAIAAMIGNALPPEFIKRHAKNIVRELRERAP